MEFGQVIGVKVPPLPKRGNQDFEFATCLKDLKHVRQTLTRSVILVKFNVKNDLNLT